MASSAERAKVNFSLPYSKSNEIENRPMQIEQTNAKASSFFATIDLAVNLIKDHEECRKALASKMLSRAENLKSPDALDDVLFVPVEKPELNETVAGIDSGFANVSMLSIEIVLVRAVAAIFKYKKNMLEHAYYLPEIIQMPEPIINSRILQNEDIMPNKSLQRLLKEITLASETIERFKPDFCFLDGSIIPQRADKPRKNSSVRPLYKEVVNAFESLYKKADENNCMLVACVEDSRGTRLQEILGFSESESLCNDAFLLSYVLKEGQRSFAFPYSKNPEEHPVLKDFQKKYAERLYAFYLRASNYDLPLRVEFLASTNNHSKIKEELERISAVCYALSSGHREYSYPSVLIEADIHARLRPEEINIVMDKIYCKLQAHAKLLRRNRRPF